MTGEGEYRGRGEGSREKKKITTSNITGYYICTSSLSCKRRSKHCINIIKGHLGTSKVL